MKLFNRAAAMTIAVPLALTTGCKSNVAPPTITSAVVIGSSPLPYGTGTYTELDLGNQKVKAVNSFRFPVKIGETYTVCLTSEKNSSIPGLQGVTHQVNGKVVALAGTGGRSDTEYCGKEFGPEFN